jgi:hypothetical protein
MLFGLQVFWVKISCKYEKLLYRWKFCAAATVATLLVVQDALL